MYQHTLDEKTMIEAIGALDTGSAKACFERIDEKSESVVDTVRSLIYAARLTTNKAGSYRALRMSRRLAHKSPSIAPELARAFDAMIDELEERLRSLSRAKVLSRHHVEAAE